MRMYMCRVPKVIACVSVNLTACHNRLGPAEKSTSCICVCPLLIKSAVFHTHEARTHKRGAIECILVVGAVGAHTV